MKKNPLATANAAALTIGIVYLVCAFSIIFIPDIAFSIAQTWFHGVVLSAASNTAITPISFVVGLVTSSVWGWVVGYVYSYFYTMFLKK